MGWQLLIGVLLLGISSFGQETNQVRTLDKGAFGGIQEPLHVVVTNKADWAELWQKHSAQKLPPPAPPEIDFSKESVIFVTLGRKNTGGYSVEITDVKRKPNNVEVLISSKEPKPGGFAIQSLTAPFHIVAVPKIEEAVKFKGLEPKKGA